jgi:hypothetical protein
MHRPPAVSYSVVRSRWHGRILLALWGLGAVLAQLALWWYAYSALASAILECACIGAGVCALWAWRAAPTGLLRWDGEHWQWSGLAGEPVRRLTVHFDFQALVLVSVQGPGSERVWLWLERASVSRTQWLALRRALVASRKPPQPALQAVPYEQLP